MSVEQAVTQELAEQGSTDFWVVFDDQADLSAAHEIDDWAERGQYVYDQLTATAEASQAELVDQLAAQGVNHEPFWITNSVFVRDGDYLALEGARRMPGVAEIRADQPVELPDPIEADDDDARVNAVEWGIANIGADQVWSEIGVRGEGIVVGSIDTGVEFGHPALVEQYRGNNGDGTFDHDYNWWDPSEACGSPVPCDHHNHGTHTVGTMVGDDEEGNQVGVAPGAEWIAAKGCPTSQCSTDALLSSGQFMLAPTDVNGENPRPDLRPNIVNNSWGSDNGSLVSPFYRDIVTAWTAAGIFGVFSNGNAGPSCDTAGSPADYVESFAVGAYDVNNQIAEFSSRGSGEDGVVRPSISAPGVGVRSSVRGDGYALASGTSMASPHLSGAVALMWSVAPSLVGNVDLTRQFLAETAVDVEDLTCGGEPGNNNVWGEGRLDAYEAAQAAPAGPTGSLTGAVTDGASDEPIAEATVRVEVDGRQRLTTTAADGTYTLRALLTGTREVTVQAFGYLTRTEPVEIVEGETSSLDFPLEVAPTHEVSGTVIDDLGEVPAAGATVQIADTPIAPVAIDADGEYRFEAVPEGSYTIEARGDGCFAVASKQLVVDGPGTTQNLQLAQRADSYGHTCRVESAAYVDATESVSLPPLPDPTPFWPGLAEIDLPFLFPFYGSGFDTAYVGLNGFITFVPINDPTAVRSAGGNRPIPAVDRLNAAIYPFWDNVQFIPPEEWTVFTATVGEPGDRRFVIEWRTAYPQTGQWGFEVVLHESGEITFQYQGIDPDDDAERGGEATVGIESPTGTDAMQYSFDRALLADERAIRYNPSGGLLSGAVTDPDGRPAGEVTVTATRSSDTRNATTREDDGTYVLPLPAGDWQVEFSRPRYQPDTREVTISEGEVTRLDVALATAAASVTPEEIDISLTAGQRETVEMEVTNTGNFDLDWQALEVPGEWSHEPGSQPAPGEVLSSFPVSHEPNFLQGPGYVGYANERLWVHLFGAGGSGLGDLGGELMKEYHADGIPTGRQFVPPWDPDPEDLPLPWSAGDMAFDASRGLMCQRVREHLHASPDTSIACWDPEAGTGALMDSMTGPWSVYGGLELAHDPNRDIFYVDAMLDAGAGPDTAIYQVAGFTHPAPGEILGECHPTVWMGATYGSLVHHRATNTLWTHADHNNSPESMDAVIRLDPDTCSVIETLETGIPADSVQAAINQDDEGNLWISTYSGPPFFDYDPYRNVYQVASGLSEVRDLPWLEMTGSEGMLAPGESQTLQVSIDTAELVTRPGIYTAEVVLASNAGFNRGRLSIPIQVEVVPDSDDDVIPPAVWSSLDGEKVWEDGTGWVYAGGPDKSVTVTLDARDNYQGTGVAGIEYRVNDGAWTEYTEPFTLTEPSRHTVTYRATDQAQNTSDEVSEHPVIAAGRVAAEQTDLEVTVPADGSTTGTVTVTNTGNRPTDLSLFERIPTDDAPIAAATPPSAMGNEVTTTAAASTEPTPVPGEVAAPSPNPAPDPDPAAAGPIPAGSEQAAPAEEDSPWVELPELPFDINGHSAVSLAGKLYTFGGWTWDGDGDGTSQTGQHRADVYVLDVAGQSQVWQRLADMPAPRRRAATGVIDGKVYLAGGVSTAGNASMAIYDPATDRWTGGADMPEPLYDSGSAVVYGQLYVIGGIQPGLEFSRSVLRYDPATDTWERLADYPGPIWLPSCGGIDDRLYCAGGYVFGNTEITANAYVYDPQTDTWERVEDMPVGLASSAYAVANDRLLISGSRYQEAPGNPGPTGEGYAYDPATETWSALPATDGAPLGAAGACGFYRIGGSPTRFGRLVEMLPGYDQCEYEPLDVVPWFEVSPSSARLEPGESAEVTVTLDASAVSELGTVTAALVAVDDSPYAMEPITVKMTVEPAPVTFDGLRESVEAFEADGDVTKAGAKRLLTALDQAERHHDRGADGRAITVLERFKETAGDQKFVPSEAARDALISDAEQLIAQLRTGEGGAGAGVPAAKPGLESVPV